jgi:hypothetical protein
MGLSELKSGVIEAVSTCNDGSISRMKMFAILGIQPGHYMERILFAISC